ncbi:MAG: caspase family protein [Bacteroidota bacterium]
MSISTPNVALPFSQSHAFIIGIDNYKYLSVLHTAVNDAKALADQLDKQHGFLVHPPLYDASIAELQDLIEHKIPQLIKKDDRVLFYFAGHGIALDSEEGPNGYLVAADTRAGQKNTLLPMRKLHDALTQLPCRHGLLILDCCFLVPLNGLLVFGMFFLIYLKSSTKSDFGVIVRMRPGR